MLSYPITANPKKPKKNNLIIVSKDKKKYVGLVTRVRTDVVSRYALHNPGFMFDYTQKKSKKMNEVGAFYRTSEYIQVTWTGNAPKIKHQVDKDGCLWYCWGVDGDWVIVT